MAEDITPGKDTSEYKVTQSTRTWAIIGTVIGLITTVGSTVATALGTDTKAGIIAGAVIAVVCAAEEALVALGYIKSRTDVKMVAEE